LAKFGPNFWATYLQTGLNMGSKLVIVDHMFAQIQFYYSVFSFLRLKNIQELGLNMGKTVRQSIKIGSVR